MKKGTVFYEAALVVIIILFSVGYLVGMANHKGDKGPSEQAVNVQGR